MLFNTLTSIALGASAAFAATTQNVNVGGVPAVVTYGSSSGGKVAAASCPGGQYLTYAIKTSPFNGTTLAKAQATLGNWTNSAPGKHISSTGSNAVGSTRTWNTTDASLGETTSNKDTLTSVTKPSSSSSNLEQKWTSGSAKYTGSLTISSASHDLTVQGNSANQLSLQYYINACCSSQTSCNSVLPKILTDALTYWIAEVRA